jgi:misacylated tRNA(Ala) deacylase
MTIASAISSREVRTPGSEKMPELSTDLLFLRDAYATSCSATVVEAATDGDVVRLALDRTTFYPTGGGQPHDLGELAWDGTWRSNVVDVRKQGPLVWHTLAAGAPVPDPGTTVTATIDWDRRHALMRTHSALHVLCGVIWNEWSVPVTGGNMEPLAARMDFELDPTPEGFGARVDELVAAEIAADRPIEVSFLPRSEAVLDEALIRTKLNRVAETVPETVAEIRVVDIVGLDKQADGGTHVRRTGEIGRVRVVKTESKGKGNKRVRIVVEDAATVGS